MSCSGAKTEDVESGGWYAPWTEVCSKAMMAGFLYCSGALTCCSWTSTTVPVVKGDEEVRVVKRARVCNALQRERCREAGWRIIVGRAEREVEREARNGQKNSDARVRLQINGCTRCGVSDEVRVKMSKRDRECGWHSERGEGKEGSDDGKRKWDEWRGMEEGEECVRRRGEREGSAITGCRWRSGILALQDWYGSWVTEPKRCSLGVCNVGE